MSHLRPQAIHDLFLVVETDAGTEMFPADLVGVSKEGNLDPLKLNLGDYIEGREVFEVECVLGWFSRLSAPGYMDCTGWSGPFEDEEDALAHTDDVYGKDSFLRGGLTAGCLGGFESRTVSYGAASCFAEKEKRSCYVN